MNNTLSLNRSILGRLRNVMVTAIKEHHLLPKAIIIVLDDDLTNGIRSHFSYVFGALLHWLCEEYSKIIEGYKDKLPVKSVKTEYPTIIWIAPPQHAGFTNNPIREKMDKVMKKTIEDFNGQIMLRMKKIWDPQDTRLTHNGTLMEVGFKTYWASINSAIQFWDRHLAPKSTSFNHFTSSGTKLVEDKLPTFFKHQGGTKRPWNNYHGNVQGYNQFHWKRPKTVQNVQRRLPKVSQRNY